VDEYWQFPVMEFYMVGKISIHMQTLSAYFIAKLTCHNNDKKLGKGCPNKSTRFNFVIKRTIYSTSADIFISVQSTHNAINCGTQYPTNVPHNSAGTLLLFWQNSQWHFCIIAAQFRLWHVKSLPWAQELFVVCWHRHKISQTPKKRSRTVSNHTILVASSDRHCVRWHGQEIFLPPTQLFRAQCDRMCRPAGTTSSISIPSNWGYKNSIIIIIIIYLVFQRSTKVDIELVNR